MRYMTVKTSDNPKEDIKVKSAETAGKAVRLSQSVKFQATNSAGGQLGWFKLATVSGAKLAAIHGNSSYSATLLINGINEPALSFGGIVEIDCRIESSQIVTDSNRIQPKILCGGLREEYICAVPNTETNELDVYFLINSSYAGYSATVIDEGYTRLMQPSETAITLAGTFYNAETPSGAVYAVNVNSAATAEMLSSTQLQSADDLNNLYGSEYYGKNFWWAGNGYPINAPYNSGGYLQVNNIAGYTLQAAYIFSVKSDNNIPTEYQRVKGQNGVWSEWEEIATSEGTYPNLTAGKAVGLARTATASGNNTENTIGWWKIGEVTAASLTEYVSFGGDYSIIFLINGISPMGSTTNFGKSGIIELDGRVENGAFLIAAQNQLKILGGNIEEGDISAVWSAEKIELYCNLKNGYSKQSFTVLSEIIHTNVVNCFAFAPSFVSASIPSGASIGVNQNRAAYDAAGNDISETYAKQSGTYPDLTAGKAISDADGNDISETYATKTEVAKISSTEGSVTGLGVNTIPVINSTYDINGLTVPNLNVGDYVLASVRFSTMSTTYYFCLLKYMGGDNSYLVVTAAPQTWNVIGYYQHFIAAPDFGFTTTIINTSASAINNSTKLRNCLVRGNFIYGENNNMLPATGAMINSNDITLVVIGLQAGATDDDLCMVLNTGAKLTGIRYDTLIDTVCTLSILNAN